VPTETRQLHAVGVKDVAALARVSPGTVSNVLNHPDRVSADARHRVEDAIRKLGFVRNHAARQLRVGHSRMVGLIVLDMSNPFFTDVARGADDACEDFGTAVLVGNSDQTLTRERRYLEAFEEQRVRGVLLSPVGDATQGVQRLVSQGIPVVLLDHPAPAGSAIPSISMDDEMGGWLAARHLIAQGRTRLSFVGLARPALGQVQARLAGVRRAVAESPGVNLELTPPPDVSMAAGRTAAEALIRRAEPLPDGIICPTDIIALGVLHALLVAGIDVPGQTAVIGYDDIETAATAAVPLSTVRQPAREMGATAVRLLEQILSGDQSSENSQIVFQPELIVRSTTA
jgi:LacI family transcriptional regulator